MEHSKRAHSILSASGSSRWLHCTPSALLEEKFGEKKESQFANEGTLAHELSELYIKKDILNTISESEFDTGLEKIMSNELFSPEMIDSIIPYIDYIESQYNAAKTEDKLTRLIIEQHLDLRKYIPDGFGTADAVILSNNKMQVIDLKYGKGVPVYATYNTQLMIYGLGAIEMLGFVYSFDTVELTIVQPRIDNISSFQISLSELCKWAEETLVPAANLAIKGEGELQPGGWCKFCSVKNKCRALCEEQLKIAKYEFKKPDLLTDDEISDILKRTPPLVEWANSICDYANEKAIREMKKWPGYKLVESTSRRKWLNEEAAEDAIKREFPSLTNEEIYTTKLAPITEIEKLVGKTKFREKLKDVVIKPSGKPILVPEDDKRPAIGLEQAEIDFKD